MTFTTPNQIIRFKDVLAITGLGKSTAYNKIHDGLLPPPISLGARSVGFILSEIEKTISAMIEGKTNTEIQQLISEMVVARANRKGADK